MHYCNDAAKFVPDVARPRNLAAAVKAQGLSRESAAAAANVDLVLENLRSNTARSRGGVGCDCSGVLPILLHSFAHPQSLICIDFSLSADTQAETTDYFKVLVSVFSGQLQARPPPRSRSFPHPFATAGRSCSATR